MTTATMTVENNKLLTPRIETSPVATPSVTTRVREMIEKGFACNSFVGDFVDSMKRAGDWSSWVSGKEASPEAVRIAEAGGSIKNLMEFLEFPERLFQVFDSLGSLGASVSTSISDTIQSIADLGANVLMAGQSVLEGAELGEKVGLVGESVVKILNPFESLGTLAFGLKSSLENISETYAHSGKDGDGNKVTLHLLKLARAVCFVAVGALAAAKAFFQAAYASWIVPALLTGAIVSSVTSRFFEGLVIDKWSAPARG